VRTLPYAINFIGPAALIVYTWLPVNAYLFNAGITQTQMVPAQSRSGGMMLQSFDNCLSMIVAGNDAGAAQARFEEVLSKAAEVENPPEVQIKKVVGVQLMDQLFTETGPEALDLAKIREQWLKGTLEQAADEFEQGYWINANEAVPPETGKLTLEDLERCVPDDLKTGLNWSREKQFFYLLTVLARWAAPPVDEPEEFEPDEERPHEEDQTSQTAAHLEASILALPEMRDKDAAVIIRAHNSVVAAWLWRKFAWEQTELALNEIHITPLCDMIL